jgi:hypothetical protein
MRPFRRRTYTPPRGQQRSAKRGAGKLGHLRGHGEGGPSGVKDLAGNALAADVRWTFAVDATLPAVTTTAPVAGATGVAPTSVTVTFNKAMTATTIDTTSVTLTDPGAALSFSDRRLQRQHVDGDMTPAALANSGSYGQSRAGRAASRIWPATRWPPKSDRTFAVDATPPTVTGRRRRPGDRRRGDGAGDGDVQ